MEPNDSSRVLRLVRDASAQRQTESGFGISSMCGSSILHFRVSGNHFLFSNAILRVQTPG
jgi:hypothetical protein